MKSNKLKNDCYWNKKRTKWKQPPVPIRFGDLVDIEYSSTPLLGRYIGNGIGVAIIHGSQIVKGHVTGRGLDRNPKLVSDAELMQMFEEK